MITILSSPKPFIGKAHYNQEKAIRSWLALDNDLEIILYGKIAGESGILREPRVRCVPDVKTSKFDTPLFNSIAEHAARHARYDIQAYINCDIILPKEFLSAVRMITFRDFLMIGQRFDLAEDAVIDISGNNWLEDAMRLALDDKITLHAPDGSDYFVFRRGMWSGMHPVIIGRGAYDNILIEHCLRRRIPVVDASPACPVFHGYHDYNHVEGLEEAVFAGEEARQNVSFSRFLVTLCDADWQLRGGDAVRSWARGDLLRALQARIGLTLGRYRLARSLDITRKIFMRRGSLSARHRTVSMLNLYKSAFSNGQ